MSAVLLLLLPHLLLVPLGVAAAFHPAVRALGLPARIGVSYAAGTIGLTVESLLFSLLRIPWSVPGLFVPLLLLSVLLAAWFARRPAGASSLRLYRPRPAVAIGAALAAALGLWHLTASLATSRATSVDYVFFWGVKAARFAAARGIDTALLANPYFLHAVPRYPPLVPVVGAWTELVTGRMLWRASLLTTALWLIAGTPIVLACLRRRMSDDGATSVAAFWAVALSTSLAFSYSGGSAESPLLFFETVAGVALLAERKEGPPEPRFLPALALAGAALTKVEGTLGALLLVAGVLLRDRLEGRRRVFARGMAILAAPLSAVLLWFSFQLVSGLPVGYRGHGRLFGLHFEHLGTILLTGLQDLRAGAYGLSWLFPLLALVFFGRNRRAALPGLVLTGGLLLFLAFDYLHDPWDPSERIGWTLPRVSQPALSLLVLAAGVACFSLARESRQNAPDRTA